VDRTILQLMDVVGTEAEVVAETARAWLKSNRPDCEFAKCPVGLQRRIVQIQLQDQGIEAGFDLIESLRLGTGQPICVSPGSCIQLDDAGRLSRAVSRGKFQEARKVVRLKGWSGTVEFAGVEFTWRTTTGRGAKRPRSGPRQEIFDASPIGSQIVLRHWQPGDRFRPIGMKSAVKLQDWFTNRKVPADQRRGLVVATTARGEIFWIEGQRIADRFKLTTGTRRRLIWHWNQP
jgi:tRNA(Ile)-lysidine synthetase-like protein